MALKLNIYRTIPGVTAATATAVYTAPTGYTGVVLLGNIANIGTTTRTVSVFHRRSGTDTAIVENFPLPKNTLVLSSQAKRANLSTVPINILGGEAYNASSTTCMGNW